MKNILIASFAFVALGLLAPAAQATVVVPATISTNSVVLVATPSISGVANVVRAITLCNDTSTATCVQISNNALLIAGAAGGGTVKFAICAAAKSCSSTPALAQPNPQGPQNGLAGFYGENMSFTGAIEATSGATGDLSSGPGGLTLTLDYFTPSLR